MDSATLDEKRLYEIAAELGEPKDEMKKWVNLPKTVDALQKDIEMGRKHGVNRTPTLDIHGTVLGGVMLDKLEKMFGLGTKAGVTK